MKKKRRILFLTTEVSPFNPESPLAEMSRHLPRVLRSMGHDIRVVMPKYSFVKDRNYNLREVIRLKEIPVPISGSLEWVSAKSGFIPDTRVQVYFLENEKYFARPGVINNPETGKPFEDNDERFIALARSAIIMLKSLAWEPEIIHCVDYTCGMVPYYIKKIYNDDPFYKSTKVILSLVNYSDIGSYSPSVAFKAGVNPNDFKSGFDAELNGEFCFLKAGMMNADKILYNGENSLDVLPDNFKKWMQGFRNKNKKLFCEQKFGLDQQIWNPDKDEKISANYSHRDLTGKSENRDKLNDKYSLKPKDNTPLVGCIWEGGDFKPLKKIVEKLKEIGGTFVISDKTADEKSLADFRNIAPKNIGIVKLLTGLTVKQLMAGSDMMILGEDKYSELLHLKAMKFGAVPIVPKKGYFGDDVVEEGDEGIGFVYGADEKDGLNKAFQRALNRFKDEKDWTALTKRAMKYDPNWNKISRSYNDVYDEIA